MSALSKLSKEKSQSKLSTILVKDARVPAKAEPVKEPSRSNSGYSEEEFIEVEELSEDIERNSESSGLDDRDESSEEPYEKPVYEPGTEGSEAVVELPADHPLELPLEAQFGFPRLEATDRKGDSEFMRESESSDPRETSHMFDRASSMDQFTDDINQIFKK